MSRVVVIGAGLAGMVSALMAREAGHNVTIISRGMGGLLLSNGTLDLLGWSNSAEPANSAELDESNASATPVQALAPAFAQFVAANPAHPYAQIGFANAAAGISWLSKHLSFFASLRPDEITENLLVPTAVGAVRPTAVVPQAMQASVLRDGDQLLIAGLRRIKDFPAALIADNLSRSPFVNIQARSVVLDLPVRDGEADASGTTYARALDQGLQDTEFADFLQLLQREIRPGEKVLVPAVLGIKPETFREFSDQLGAPIGEIPLPPPSISGRRIHEALTQMCRDARIDIQLNAVVKGFTESGKRVTGLQVQRAGRVHLLRADVVIDAAGGFESGNLERDSHLRIHETIFKLPLYAHNAPAPDFAAENIFRSGVMVNQSMRPIDADGELCYENLYCVGSVLGGALAWKEKSGEGISLGSAYAATAALGTANESGKED